MPRINNDNDIILRMRAIEKRSVEYKKNDASVLEAKEGQPTPRARILTSRSGSQNEQDELTLLLSKQPKDEYRELVNRYGSEFADRIFKEAKEGNKKMEALKLAEREKVSLDNLEAKYKEEKAHNDSFAVQVQKEYEAERSNNMIKKEEMGWTTI